MVPNDSYTHNTRKVVTDLTNRIGETFLALTRLRQRFLAENGVWNRFESQCAFALSEKFCQKNWLFEKFFGFFTHWPLSLDHFLGLKSKNPKFLGPQKCFFGLGFSIGGQKSGPSWPVFSEQTKSRYRFNLLGWVSVWVRYRVKIENSTEMGP